MSDEQSDPTLEQRVAERWVEIDKRSAERTADNGEPQKDTNLPKCFHCHGVVYEQYEVHEGVLEEAKVPKTHRRHGNSQFKTTPLHIMCLAFRLDRDLAATDFTGSPHNTITFYFRTLLLNQREALEASRKAADRDALQLFEIRQALGDTRDPVEAVKDLVERVNELHHKFKAIEGILLKKDKEHNKP
jgi:hypothetical protein